MSAETKAWLAVGIFTLACVIRPVATGFVEIVAVVSLVAALWFALRMVRGAE